MSAKRGGRHIYKQFRFDFNDVQKSVDINIEHRQYANAGPLGLSAFAAVILIISLVNLQADNVVHPNIAIGMGTSIQ